MSVLEQLPNIESIIRHYIVVEKRSYESVSDELKRQYGSTRGLSTRSIRRYCRQHDIQQTSRLSQDQIDIVVAGNVSKVNYSKEIIINVTILEYIPTTVIRSGPLMGEE